MHDTKLYKCSYCGYYHFHKYLVERHVNEKHSEKVLSVIVVRELDTEGKETERHASTDENSENPAEIPSAHATVNTKSWRCGLCKFRSSTITDMREHARVAHDVKSQFMCGVCQYKNSYVKNFENHFATKHPGEAVNMIQVYYKDQGSKDSDSDPNAFDTTPLWSRHMPRVRHIRGILFEDQTVPKATKTKISDDGEVENKKGIKRRKSSIQNDAKEKEASLASSPRVSSSRASSVTSSPASSKKNDNVMFVCSVCDSKFKCATERELAEHLCLEMNYEKFICTYCSKKSHSFDFMKEHLQNAHGKPWKPEFIVSLTIDLGIETFILQEINNQAKLVYGDSFKKITNLTHLFESTPDVRQTATRNIDFNNIVSNKSPYLEDGIDDIEVPKPKKHAEDDFIDPRQTDKNQCPHCDYNSKLPNDVIKHVLRHWTMQPYKCKVCGIPGNRKSFILRHGYERHRGVSNICVTVCEPKDIPIRPMAFIRRKRACEENITSKQAKAPEVQEVRSSISPELKKVENPVLKTPEKRRRLEKNSSFENIEKTPVLPTSEDQCVDVEVLEHDSIDDIINEVIEAGDVVEVGEVEKEVDEEPKNDIMYLCSYCPKRGDSVKAIRDHWELIHKNTRQSSSAFQYYTRDINNLPVRGRVMCAYCGFRGSKKLVIKHHKVTHLGLRIQLSASTSHKPNIKYNCRSCTFACYDLKILKSHYEQNHIGKDFSALFASEISADEVIKGIDEIKVEDLMYQCKWCDQICADEEEGNKHHVLFHSHLKSQITPMKSISNVRIPLKYCCPKCPHTSESFVSMVEHLRLHAKPYICNYCGEKFSFPRTVKQHNQKKHPGMEPLYDSDEKVQHEFMIMKNNLGVALEDGGTITFLEYKKNKRKSDPDTKKHETDAPPSQKAIKLSAPYTLTTNPTPPPSVIVPHLKTYPVAKKSTTQVATKQIAKKSTTPFLRETSPSEFSVSIETDGIIIDDDEDEPIREPTPEPSGYYSFYGKKRKEDNSNITTTMGIGCMQMRVNIPTLMQITNIFPQVRVTDLKNEKLSSGSR